MIVKNFILITLISFFLLNCQQKDTQVEASENDPIKQVTELKACSKDAKACPNGNSVGRDINNNCEFFACKNKPLRKDTLMCTADAKQCADGSFVARDPNNNCKFNDCPSGQDASNFQSP